MSAALEKRGVPITNEAASFELETSTEGVVMNRRTIVCCLISITALALAHHAAAQEKPAPQPSASPATPAPVTPTPPAATQPQDIKQILEVLADAIRTKNDPMRMRMWFRVREQGEKAAGAQYREEHGP